MAARERAGGAAPPERDQPVVVHIHVWFDETVGPAASVVGTEPVAVFAVVAVLAVVGVLAGAVVAGGRAGAVVAGLAAGVAAAAALVPAAVFPVPLSPVPPDSVVEVVDDVVGALVVVVGAGPGVGLAMVPPNSTRSPSGS